MAAEGGVSLWLHGHRHHAYHFQEPPLAPFPVICIGSATQSGLWSFGEYTIEGLDCRVQRYVFDPDAGSHREGPAFQLRLRAGETASSPLPACGERGVWPDGTFARERSLTL